MRHAFKLGELADDAESGSLYASFGPFASRGSLSP